MFKEKSKYKPLIIALYAVAFVFFAFKMFFYSQYVARFPDEIQHISYIAYLEKTHAIIPDFKNMTFLVQNNGQITSSTNLNLVNLEKIGQNYTFGDSFNYLGHPPLYYDLMLLSRAVQVHGSTVTVHIFRLRCFSMALSSLAMLLVLYIGLSRVGKNPFLHGLYAAISVSVPMLAYDSAGINNDACALLGVSVFLLGLLRFSERKRNYGTYLLVGSGVLVAFLSKLTTGTIVLVSLFLFCVLSIIKEKSARFILSKQFLVSLPAYAITAAYYLAVYLQTGSLQPTYARLNPQGFYQSGFYVAPQNRSHMDFFAYTAFYFKKFWGSWTGIGSYITSGRAGSLLSVNRIAVFALMVLPILLLFQYKRGRKNSFAQTALICVYAGVVCTAVIQWLRAFHEYANVSGYMGGFQSRYYLCAISALALAVPFVLKNCLKDQPVTVIIRKVRSMIWPQANYAAAAQTVPDKVRVNYRVIGFSCICLAYSGLLIYEDFIYFLIHFKSYF